jgi:hypothetical protein
LAVARKESRRIVTDGINDAQRMADDHVRSRRGAERDLQKRGFLRCTTYMGNLARMNDIPVERGPGILGPTGDDESDWVPAWFDWHLQRFKSGRLQHISQRERLAQAKELLADKEKQFILLSEAQLVGGTLYDPSADISTNNALELLKQELGYEEDKDGME